MSAAGEQGPESRLAELTAALDRERALRVQAEERLREAEARIRALTDHLPGGYVFQLATPLDGSDRRFLYVSQGFERMTGVAAEAVLADPAAAYDLILPLAVAMLFFGEFLLRSRLLPQAPRHTLPGFLGALGRVWPKLIEE